ncbi:winged helix-turn-helix transcriptional regulator [Streptomyces sp. NPDC002018]|uniref:winged helix-turn-helix transcriptional regulator n=1 Tax=Streptomyces sp. NPDC002018 TaxID=3364629 RepID=UPI0036751AA4
MTARPCSLAAALAVVGEKYSPLVLREIFFGVHRFDAIARNTGAPRDVLAARLRRLVDAGVLEKRLYHERPPRYEYDVTEAGRELRPVLLMLMRWGDRHLADVPPTVYQHSCGSDLDPAIMCRSCGEQVHRGELTQRVQAPGWDALGQVEA